MGDKGRDPEFRGNVVAVILGILFVTIVIVTIAILGSGDSDEPSAQVTPEPTVTAAPSPPVEPSFEPLPVLASGKDEDFVFGVINVERDVLETIDDGRPAEGVFTLVTLRVENVGDEPLGFSASDVGAFDPTGQLWMSDNLDKAVVTTVAPGGSIEKVIIFDVPEGIRLTAISATGSSTGPVATTDGVEIPLP